MLFKDRGYKAASSDRDWSLSPQNTWLTSPPNGNNFFNWINFKWIVLGEFLWEIFWNFWQEPSTLVDDTRESRLICLSIEAFPSKWPTFLSSIDIFTFWQPSMTGTWNFFFSAGYANFGSRPDRVIWCDSPFTGQSSERYANGREIVRFHLIETSDFGAPHLHFHRPLPPQLTTFDSPWTALSQDFWLGFDLINSLSATFNQSLS